MSDDCLWYSVTLALDILSLSVPSHPFFLFFFLPFVLFVPFVVIHSSFLPPSLPLPFVLSVVPHRSFLYRRRSSQ